MSPEIVESSICKLLILIFLICPGLVLSEFVDGERTSLMMLKEHLDPNHTTILHSNWTKAHCYNNISHWIGVTCINGRATQLSLDSMGFYGSIGRDAFVNVTELRVLSLKNNSLKGSLPDFSHVYFIKQIDFSYNKLTGQIPWRLVYLLFLKELYLQNNELTGSIPPFNHACLKAFNVSYNHLTGSIPNTAVLNSFDKSAYLGNDLMCSKTFSYNCSSLSAPPPSPSPSPSPSTHKPPAHSTPSTLILPSPVPDSKLYSTIHNKSGLSKDIIILISIASAAIVLIVIVLFASLYHKFISSRE
ncbi:hypothetical protein SUGI_1064660 [Cryptomeria japonica]|nr:hypothetical protein SUGI_1064660 [Cryptomeria japonica]